MKPYVLVLKTGEAEIRAIQESSKDVTENLVPLIELTRGRKRPQKEDKPLLGEVSPFEKRLEILKRTFKNQVVYFDLTSESGLLNETIKKLYLPDNGYKNWVDFIVNLKNENVFKEIIPTIIVNVEDPNFETNLVQQVKNFENTKLFSRLLYRNALIDDGCYDDLTILNQIDLNLDLEIMVDCGYIPPSFVADFSKKAVARIQNIKKVLNRNDIKFILSGTSFPNSIGEIGREDKDVFSLHEIDVFEDVKSQLELTNLCYSDYGSINPVRNDIKMARGWVPRIDVPLMNSIFYYRQRRPPKVTTYSETYHQVAKLVCADPRFPKELTDSWGMKQILSASTGAVPGTRPSFWISVRMNLHLIQQICRLKLFS